MSTVKMISRLMIFWLVLLFTYSHYHHSPYMAMIISITAFVVMLCSLVIITTTPGRNMLDKIICWTTWFVGVTSTALAIMGSH